MDDAIGLAEALLGLDGFRVLTVEETPDEVGMTVETVADVLGAPLRCARSRPRIGSASTSGTCPASDVRPGSSG